MRVRHAHGGGAEVHMAEAELLRAEKQLNALADAMELLAAELERNTRLIRKVTMQFNEFTRALQGEK
jgi:hypothetical protein